MVGDTFYNFFLLKNNENENHVRIEIYYYKCIGIVYNSIDKYKYVLCLESIITYLCDLSTDNISQIYVNNRNNKIYNGKFSENRCTMTIRDLKNNYYGTLSSYNIIDDHTDCMASGLVKEEDVISQHVLNNIKKFNDNII